MRLFKQLSAIMGLLLFGFSTQASADHVLYSENPIQWQASAVKVGFNRHVPDNAFIIVERVETYWVEQPYGIGRVRVTVPVRYYLTSWDVEALERELERLGVKVKPKPAPPKPGFILAPIYSG